MNNFSFTPNEDIPPLYFIRSFNFSPSLTSKIPLFLNSPLTKIKAKHWQEKVQGTRNNL